MSLCFDRDAFFRALVAAGYSSIEELCASIGARPRDVAWGDVGPLWRSRVAEALGVAMYDLWNATGDAPRRIAIPAPTGD